MTETRQLDKALVDCHIFQNEPSITLMAWILSFNPAVFMTLP